MRKLKEQLNKKEVKHQVRLQNWNYLNSLNDQVWTSKTDNKGEQFTLLKLQVKNQSRTFQKTNFFSYNVNCKWNSVVITVLTFWMSEFFWTSMPMCSDEPDQDRCEIELEHFLICSWQKKGKMNMWLTVNCRFCLIDEFQQMKHCHFFSRNFWGTKKTAHSILFRAVQKEKQAVSLFCSHKSFLFDLHQNEEWNVRFGEKKEQCNQNRDTKHKDLIVLFVTRKTKIKPTEKSKEIKPLQVHQEHWWSKARFMVLSWMAWPNPTAPFSFQLTSRPQNSKTPMLECVLCSKVTHCPSSKTKCEQSCHDWLWPIAFQSENAPQNRIRVTSKTVICDSDS